MRWLWYALCVVSTIVAVRVVLLMPVQQPATARTTGEMVGRVIGAFVLPVVFFYLGRQASRRARNQKET